MNILNTCVLFMLFKFRGIGKCKVEIIPPPICTHFHTMEEKPEGFQQPFCLFSIMAYAQEQI